ncbi:uncharacterized protein C8Q71DRAFT_796266 [Rhodofomes roseus]|uniref:Protein-S-isoprenylcysteine O-methyltransferase n=1 Tax=Rhodofomes roseus TaxID=34475 RepID=A0ABQ8KJZ9_9APHY|nr:uncharacterized protein C8Q71DRAFT_796266 [Rhodofomes roseus]KAH9837818.1 hypothetical protein C8Q71DRAFT_796266 [Rhodofomes roseus]
MSARSVLHVGLLCSAAYMTYCSSTSPTPPPSDEEVKAQADISTMERLFTRVARSTASMLKYTSIAGAGCTVAAICAREYSSTYSDTVLQKLIFPGIGSAARISITPIVLAGWSLTMLGTSLRLWCFRTLDRFFTFEVTLKEGHQLCTGGPYSLVRHPSYTGWIIQCIGMATLNGGAGSWARESGFLGTVPGQIAACAFLAVEMYMCMSMVHRCSEEDRLLRNRFGDSWFAWAQRVPYRLLPYAF